MVPDLHRYRHRWWLPRDLLSTCPELSVVSFYASFGKICLLFDAAFFVPSECVGSLSCDDSGKTSWRTTPRKLHKCGSLVLPAAPFGVDGTKTYGVLFPFSIETNNSDRLCMSLNLSHYWSADLSFQSNDHVLKYKIVKMTAVGIRRWRK